MGWTSGHRPSLWVGVLGPVRAVDAAGTDVTPTGPLQRRLLALLVLRRGRIVPADDAIAALWGDAAPRDAAAALHNQVFRLRRALPPGVVESAGDGYVIDASAVAVDADDLAAAVHGAARGEQARAALEAALDRWRGAAYPELADVDGGVAEAVRLEELRVRALEARAECRLTAGEVDDAVVDLAQLVDEQPLRERPRSLLMAALAGAGRRVEALRAYDDFRRLLADELGIEPSPALASQHAELLAATELPLPEPPATLPPSRLPVPTTPLVGRHALVADVVDALAAHRVVSLVGAAGVGKTRLAVEVGHRVRATGAHAVVMCELAAAGPAAAVEQVAASLRVDPRAGVDPEDRIAESLGDAPIVIVLDGCEHVLDPVATLVERLVTRCAQLGIVATSRERLRVRGERVITVPPLDCDAVDAPGPLLFVERARAVAPSFAADGGDAERVVEVARRLDGLPLALELAAARLHTHTLDEVCAGLDERFSLLSSGYRTSARHASLRTAIAWSYELLDDDLRATFADLSVFAASFTGADAAAVVGGAGADGIAQLVERSLVVRRVDGRFTLLETLRAFARERLDSEGRADDVRDRHAAHFLDRSAAIDAALAKGGPNVLPAIDAAVPDLRVALDRFLATGRVDLASRLVVSLRTHGFLAQRPDVLAWTYRVEAADPDGRDELAALVVAASATAAWLAGDVRACGARTARALELAEASGGAVPADVAIACASVALFEGRLDEAATWYRRGVDVAADAGDDSQRLVAAASEVLALAYAGDVRGASARVAALLEEIGDIESPCAAYAWYCAGEADLGVDDGRARERLIRALDLARRTGSAMVVGIAGASLASIDARLGDTTAAVDAYRWLIPHWRRAGVWSTLWTMLRSIAVLLGGLGRHREAAVLEGAVRAAATSEGHRIFGADEAILAELSAHLRTTLGDAEYEAARAEGAACGGDAAADRALQALG